MKQTITVYPNQQLFEKTRDIPKDQITGDTYRQIGASMLEILKKSGGVGLSANQVGLPFNMCVIDINHTDPKIMLNPRIVKQSDATVKSKEGCLSLPGGVVDVNRHKDVTVAYEDVTGETIEEKANGLYSYCLQHEIDHLKGILLVNRVDEYHRAKLQKAVHLFKRRNRK